MNADTVRTLLEQQHELTDPMRSGGGFGAGGMTLMPHAAHCQIQSSSSRRCTCHLRAFVELDRLMEAMRVDRQHPLLEVGDERVSLRALHWHLHQRYRRIDTSAKTVRYIQGRLVGVVDRPGVPTTKVTPLSASQAIVGRATGWETHVQEQRHKRSKNARDARVMVASWHRDVKPMMVDLGVSWIAGHWALAAVADELQEAAA